MHYYYEVHTYAQLDTKLSSQDWKNHEVFTEPTSSRLLVKRLDFQQMFIITAAIEKLYLLQRFVAPPTRCCMT